MDGAGRGGVLLAAGRSKEAQDAYAAALDPIEKPPVPRRQARVGATLQKRLRWLLVAPISDSDYIVRAVVTAHSPSQKFLAWSYSVAIPPNRSLQSRGWEDIA